MSSEPSFSLSPPPTTGRKEQHFLCNFSVKRVVFLSQQPAKAATVKIKIGHKKFTHPSPIPIYVAKDEEEPPSSLWKTAFVASFTPHSFLFSSIIVDLYERKFFGTRRKYLGRGQIKLERLSPPIGAHTRSIGHPFSLDVRLDIYPFRLAPSNTCLLQQRYLPGAAVGYIDLQLLLTPHERDEDYRCNCILPPKDIAQIETMITDEVEVPPTTVELEHAEKMTSAGESESVTLLREQTLQCGPESQLETLFQLSIFQKDNTMRVVQSILREISDGAVFSRREFLENIVYLQRVYARHIPRKPEIIGRRMQNPQSELAMDEVLRAWNFVVASFGWRGIYASKNNLSGTILRLLRHSMLEQFDIKLFELEMMAKFLLIEQTDILDLKLFIEEELYKPCYFISNDSKFQTLRLVIRGTMSASDILLDLLYQYHPWKESYVHYGMLRAARWCFTNLAKYLISESLARGYQRIVISGHSLGGAVASLFTVMLLDTEPPIKVECVVFGPPPTASFPVASKYDDYIKVFINENDIVPQLSFGSVVQLKEIMLACKQPPTDTSCCNTSMLASASDYVRYSKLDRILENRIQVLQCPIPKLYHLGKIYHMFQQEREGKGPNAYALYEVPKEAYSEVCVRKEYLLDHMLSPYSKGLSYFCPT